MANMHYRAWRRHNTEVKKERLETLSPLIGVKIKKVNGKKEYADEEDYDYVKKYRRNHGPGTKYIKKDRNRAFRRLTKVSVNDIESDYPDYYEGRDYKKVSGNYGYVYY